jgi:hypothetical protein
VDARTRGFTQLTLVYSLKQLNAYLWHNIFLIVGMRLSIVKAGGLS